jgi:Mg-chelatase subunit ChlD
VAAFDVSAQVSESAYSRDTRWRLILGPPANDSLQHLTDAELGAMDECLELLYNADRQGELSDSLPRLHRWMGDLRKLFPTDTIHLLQKDALDRLGIHQLLLEEEMVPHLQPDIHLAGVLMESFEQLEDRQREVAKSLIRQVADQLLARLRLPLLAAVRGARLRHLRRRNPPWSQIDWPLTIRRNLRHYQPELETIIPETLLGYHNRKRQQQHLIILVDQSASMSESLIYAGLYANVLHQLPSLSVTLLAFDTKVLDLSELAQDPVDVLLGFHLGGGTDIANALGATYRYIDSPGETILILISDMEEGGNAALMLAHLRDLKQRGVRVIVLLTLSQEGNPAFDEQHAREVRRMDIPAFACSPDLFPEVMSKAMSGEDISY